MQILQARLIRVSKHLELRYDIHVYILRVKQFKSKLHNFKKHEYVFL